MKGQKLQAVDELRTVSRPQGQTKHQAKTCLRAYSGSKGPDQPSTAQSDEGNRCPLTESLTLKKCINDEQMPGWDFKYALGEPRHFAHVRRHFFA